MGDSLTEVIKVGDNAPLLEDIPIGGLATDQVAGDMYGRGAGGLIPLANTRKSVSSVDDGGGVDTFRISNQFSCTQAVYDGLTTDLTSLYFIMEE